MYLVFKISGRHGSCYMLLHKVNCRDMWFLNPSNVPTEDKVYLNKDSMNILLKTFYSYELYVLEHEE
jgi:hypothetical protein